MEDIIIISQDTYTDNVRGVKAGISNGGNRNFGSVRVNLSDYISWVSKSAGWEV